MEFQGEGHRLGQIEMMGAPGRDDDRSARAHPPGSVGIVVEDELQRTGVHDESGPDPFRDTVLAAQPGGMVLVVEHGGRPDVFEFRWELVVHLCILTHVVVDG